MKVRHLLVPSLVLSILSFGIKPAFSSQRCTSNVYRRADNYADRIVKQERNMYFAIPIGMQTKMVQCDYFPRENSFIAYMTIKWWNPIESNTPYYSKVKISGNNNTWDWKLLSWNQNLFNHLVNVGVWKAITKE